MQDLPMKFFRRIADLAARRVDDAARAECPPGLPGEDPAFTTAVTALGAKLAKADGRADGTEWGAFSDVFQPGAGSGRDIQRLYDLARQTTLGYEAYARRLAKRYGSCPQLLEDVVDGLFHIAKSDGAVTQEELGYLSSVSELLGQTPGAFRRLRATHLGAGPDDPYVILDIAPDAPDDLVRGAWKRALSASHPDRALGRGLPAEFVEVAQAKSAAINAAYDSVMRERRALAPQAVA